MSPATCTFDRITGVFYVPLQNTGGEWGVGTDTEYESAQKVNFGEENFPAPPDIIP